MYGQNGQNMPNFITGIGSFAFFSGPLRKIFLIFCMKLENPVCLSVLHFLFWKIRIIFKMSKMKCFLLGPEQQNNFFLKKPFVLVFFLHFLNNFFHNFFYNLSYTIFISNKFFNLFGVGRIVVRSRACLRRVQNWVWLGLIFLSKRFSWKISLQWGIQKRAV